MMPKVRRRAYAASSWLDDLGGTAISGADGEDVPTVRTARLQSEKWYNAPDRWGGVAIIESRQRLGATSPAADLSARKGSAPQLGAAKRRRKCRRVGWRLIRQRQEMPRHRPQEGD